MSRGDELAPLVARMRDAQKRYFATRASDALIESKKLEREVDRKLGELARERPPAVVSASPITMREYLERIAEEQGITPLEALELAMRANAKR